jgi:sulfur-carrier protein
MPHVVFTPHLRKHLSCETADVAGQTVAEALNAVFEREPNLRGYLLDDQGRVRQHVMIFVDNHPLNDREQLTDQVAPKSEIYVMQALSGG